MAEFWDPTGPPVTVIVTDDRAGALASHLDDLSTAVAGGGVPGGRDGTVSVDVLGRYRFERDILPRYPPSNLHVRFRTVHGSKGLEADEANWERFGGPSTRGADGKRLRGAFPQVRLLALAECGTPALVAAVHGAYSTGRRPWPGT